MIADHLGNAVAAQGRHSFTMALFTSQTDAAYRCNIIWVLMVILPSVGIDRNWTSNQPASIVSRCSQWRPTENCTEALVNLVSRQTSRFH